MTGAVRLIGDGHVPVLLDLGRIDSMSRAARNLLGGDGADLFTALALLVDSRVSRSIASYIKGLGSPPLPSRIFQDHREATKWLGRTFRGQEEEP